jgi:hypothetical protein
MLKKKLKTIRGFLTGLFLACMDKVYYLDMLKKDPKISWDTSFKQPGLSVPYCQFPTYLPSCAVSVSLYLLLRFAAMYIYIIYTVYIYLYIYIFIYLYIYICIHVYICMYIHMYTCIHLYICIHKQLAQKIYSVRLSM